MKEYKAPEGYYYHKDDLYCTAICMPDSGDINEYELVTEEVYKAWEAAEEARMKAEDEERLKELESEK